MTFNLRFLIIICIFRTISMINELKNCSFIDYFDKIQTSGIEINTISGFDSYLNLNFDCNQTFYFMFLYIIPDSQLLLDSYLNFRGLKVYNKYDILNIRLINLRGFEISFDAFKSIHFPKSTQINLEISYSRMIFYLNNTLLDQSLCIKSNLFKISKNEHFLASIKSLHILASNLLSTNICPYVFHNSNINEIFIHKLSGYFFDSNLFQFIDNKEELDIKSNISFVSVEIMYADLDSKFLNKNVFKSVTEINVYGILNNIEAPLFKSFKNLKYLELNLENFGEFFHRGIKWMESLNNHVRSNLSAVAERPANKATVNHIILNTFLVYFIQYQRYSYLMLYGYPDEDLCIFINFPHSNLVYPIFNTDYNLECTCTIIWLLRYSYIYYDGLQFVPDDSNKLYRKKRILIDEKSICINETLFKAALEKCKFEERFNNCIIESKPYGSDMIKFLNFFEFGLEKLIICLKWLKLILFIFTEPALCLIGLILNIMIILVAKEISKRKDIKNNLHVYMIMNSGFNICYFIIMIFEPITVCLSISSVFCSKLYFTLFSQYYKIIAITFLSSVFKLCSNMTFLSFTISRYGFILNKESNLFKRFKNLNTKTHCLVIFLTSSTLTIFKLFQYRINSYQNLFQKGFPYYYRDETVCDSYNGNNTSQNSILSSCTGFLVAKTVYTFISSFLFLILYLIIDLHLLHSIREKIKLKQSY